MQLVVFDIDDTLTQSMTADTECFVRSLEKVFGFHNVNTDWSQYKHVTDAGIISELFEREKGRLPTETELDNLKQHFLKDLRCAVEVDPILAVPGAEQVLSALKTSPQHRVAMATGAWRESAMIKLQSARLDVNGYHIASSNDHYARSEILNHAISQTQQSNAEVTFSSVVYVGDGVWDAKTCKELDIPLIGIATGHEAQRLTELGAYRVFPDLSDQSSFCETLNELDQS